MSKEIKNACPDAPGIATLDQLECLQQTLHQTNPKKLASLKASIVRRGVVFPLAVYKSKKALQIVDGDMRFIALKELEEEGYTVDTIPVYYVQAKGATEAAEIKVLSKAHYSKLNKKYLPQFLTEKDLADIADEISLPGVKVGGVDTGGVAPAIGEVLHFEFPEEDYEVFIQMLKSTAKALRKPYEQVIWEALEYVSKSGY